MSSGGQTSAEGFRQEKRKVMYSRIVFDEVQAIALDRELIAQQVQLESKALRAQASYAAEASQGQRAASPRFSRFASHFRAAHRVRLN